MVDDGALGLPTVRAPAQVAEGAVGFDAVRSFMPPIPPPQRMPSFHEIPTPHQAFEPVSEVAVVVASAPSPLPEPNKRSEAKKGDGKKSEVPTVRPPPVAPSSVAAVPPRRRGFPLWLVAATLGLVAVTFAVVRLSGGEKPVSGRPTEAQVPGLVPTVSSAPVASGSSRVDEPGATTATPSASATSAPSSPVPSDGTAPRFRLPVARKALEKAGKDIRSCRVQGSLWGTGDVLVRFSQDGRPSEITLGTPFRNTPTGQCIVQTLGKAEMGAFEGPSQNVTYRFMLPQAIPR